MKLVALALTTISLAMSLSGCGGGGGGGTASATSSDQLGLVANFADATTIATTPPVSTTTVALSAKPESLFARILNFMIPNAYASTYRTNNILAYDQNGNPIINPLKSNVNVYISFAAIDRTNKYVYLGLDDHQNKTISSGYGSLKGTKCVLYKINKSTGKVSCVMNTDNYDLRTGYSYSRAFFDNKNVLNLVAEVRGATGYKVNGAGSEIQRLVKVDINDNISVYKENDDHWVSSIAKLGNYTVISKFGMLDQATITCNPDNSCGGTVVGEPTIEIINDSNFSESSTIFNDDGNLTGGLERAYTNSLRIEKINGSWQFNPIGENFVSISSHPDGGVYGLTSNGTLYDLSTSEPESIVQLPSRISDYNYDCSNTTLCDSSAVANQDIRISTSHLIVRTGTGYCSISRNTLDYQCNDLINYANRKVRSIATLNDKGIVFFEYNNNLWEANFNLNTPESVEYSISDTSSVLISAITQNPVITFNAQLDAIGATYSTNQFASYSLITVEFSVPVQQIDTDPVTIKVNGVTQYKSISLQDYGKKLKIKVKSNVQDNNWRDLRNTTVVISLPPDATVDGETFASPIEPTSYTLNL